jgi:hypothetical protein
MTAADRRRRLWQLVLAHGEGGEPTLAHVCAALAEVALVDGAVAALASSATVRATVHADGIGAKVEELTLTLGEGPGVDAVVAGRPVIADDLGDRAAAERWPMFVPAAAAIGVAAVFALPLRVGAVRVGVVTLHRGTPGALTVAQLSDALILADLLCLMLIDPSTNGRHAGQLGPVDGMHNPEVHQAAGMISVQLGVSVDAAFSRLRAYAYGHDRPLSEVAGDVVARWLRLEPDTGDGQR